MHILFLSWWWPYPADNGSKIRIYNLLRQLARTYTVTLLAFVSPGEATTEQIAHLLTFCDRVEIVNKPEHNGSAMRSTIGYLSRYPRHLQDVYSPHMARLVAQYSQQADVIVGSQMETLRYFDLVPSLPAILEEFEITIYQNRVETATSQRTRWRAQLTLTKLEHVIERIQKRGVAVTVVSEPEKTYLQRLHVKAARVDLIPNGVDTETLRPDPAQTLQPNSLIYAGSVTYQPNHDAMQYFVHDILPLIRDQHPAVCLNVTGTTGDVDVSDLAAEPNVHFTGYLPAVMPAIQSSWVSIVPLRLGGGTRLKILESMALGTPVISTRKGAEGLNVTDGENILIADSPEAFAGAVNFLLSDPDARTRLAIAGRQLVQEQYDWAIIGHQLTQFIEATIHNKKVKFHG